MKHEGASMGAPSCFFLISGSILVLLSCPF